MYSKTFRRTRSGKRPLSSMQLIVVADRPEHLCMPRMTVHVVLRDNPSTSACWSSVAKPLPTNVLVISSIFRRCCLRASIGLGLLPRSPKAPPYVRPSPSLKGCRARSGPATRQVEIFTQPGKLEKQFFGTFSYMSLQARPRAGHSSSHQERKPRSNWVDARAYKENPAKAGLSGLALAALATSLTRFLAVIREVARVVLLILLAALALLATLLILTFALLVLLAPLFGSFTPFFGGALGIVCEIAGTTTLLVCHVFLHVSPLVLQTTSGGKGWMFPSNYSTCSRMLPHRIEVDMPLLPSTQKNAQGLGSELINFAAARRQS